MQKQKNPAEAGPSTELGAEKVPATDGEDNHLIQHFVASHTDDEERADGRPAYNELHALWEKAVDDSVTIHTQLTELHAAAKRVVELAPHHRIEDHRPGSAAAFLKARLGGDPYLDLSGAIGQLGELLESGVEPIEATEAVRQLEAKIARLEGDLVDLAKRHNDEAAEHQKTKERNVVLKQNHGDVVEKKRRNEERQSEHIRKLEGDLVVVAGWKELHDKVAQQFEQLMAVANRQKDLVTKLEGDLVDLAKRYNDEAAEHQKTKARYAEVSAKSRDFS